MTYTLFEWAKENLETLLEAQPESLIVEAMERVQVITKSHTSVINIIIVLLYVLSEVRFVNAVIAGGSVKFLPAVQISPFSLIFCVFSY